MKWTFDIAIQLCLPEKYKEDSCFKDVLKTLRELGFTGVELNIPDPEKIIPDDLEEFLDSYNLKMTMFATGATAKQRGLSLSSSDEPLRMRSVRECRAFIDFAARFQAGVIVGYLKGGPTADSRLARLQTEESLREVVPRVIEKRVPLLIEATNRYESGIANNLDGAHELTMPFGETSLVQILPDTFHMNIEEQDMYASLQKHRGCYSNLHISDNNRFFPGFGAIRFGELFDFLRSINYGGMLAIEGNIKNDLLSDIRAAMRYLAPLLTGRRSSRQQRKDQ
jgi:D-psicose/D-tagatose/L-ribulose 3-epimerase